MRQVDMIFNSMVGKSETEEVWAVQAVDANQINYNPPFVDYLNAWQGLSKTYYTIAEVEAFTEIPTVISLSGYGVTSLDELRYFNGLTTLPFRWATSTITSVIYPDSITFVGSQVWLSRPALKYFEIGNAVTEIQNYLFQTNTALTKMV